MLRPILARLSVCSSISDGFLHTPSVPDRQDRAAEED
jgi:hypothetical protein